MTALLINLSMGAAVGLVLALSGAGGGILAVPLLVFGLHLSMVQAAPVGLIAVGLASALGAVLALREGKVRYRAAVIIGVTGMAFAPLGVMLAHRLPNAPLMVG
ncbi:sulfite exporter TauE/SafE family protein, partial [Pseudacidovorax intermedius]|uniref:sulfite exporter TauE/SafE family protein n=1 Tax=Pseudacidovorax intermedius TaxID=433924 RepID=UPI0005BE73AE